MAEVTTEARAKPSEGRPVIRRVDAADLRAVLARGLDDFQAMPSHFLFLSIIYPVIGLILVRLAIGYDVLPLLFPLAAGFALVGPFAAIGLLELSRQREAGHAPYVWQALGAFQSRSFRSIAIIGIVLVAIFAAWLVTADAIYARTLGPGAPTSITGFVRDLFTTRSGWLLIILGNGMGFLYAVVAFALSVVSIPLLLDREVGVFTAMATSLEAVFVNPKAMALWGLIVAVSLFLGSVPCFLGLVVVMPILGHSTWHLYRKVVDT